MSSILEVGVDWLTCSGSIAVSGADVMLMLERAARGEKMHDSQFMGYAGWRAGSVFYGERGNRWLAQVSGFLADDYWQRLVALAERVSRLDLQMTVTYSSGASDIPETLYESAKRQRVARDAYPKLQLIVGDPTGDTFYMGDRTSDKFFRCYDKEAQSGEPEYANSVRYELECKAGYALRIASELLESASPGKDICGLVQDYLHSHGLYPALPPMVSFKIAPRRSVKSPDAVRLMWLTKQVAPTVAALIAKGDAFAVLRALGLCNSEGELQAIGAETTRDLFLRNKSWLDAHGGYVELIDKAAQS